MTDSLLVPFAYKDYDHMTNKLDRIISIQGNIGSGKSTFLDELRKRKNELNEIFGNTFTVDEPVEEWKKLIFDGNTKSSLGLFYEDLKKPIELRRYSFTFQILTYTTRLAYMINETVKLTQNSTGLIERSMRSDKEIFFENLPADEFERHVYNLFFHLNCANFNKFEECMVVLESTPNECYQRIKIRERKEEASIPLPYLHEIHEKQEEMIRKFEEEGGLVFRINWPTYADGNIQENSKYIDQLIADLKLKYSK